MSQINATVINITIDGQNYPEWAFCVDTALRVVVCTPTVVADHSNANAIQTWEINNGKVMGAMVNSVKQSMIMSLRKFRTTKTIWSHLKE